MTSKFVCFSSEDEGYRFAIGKAYSTLEDAREYIEKKHTTSLRNPRAWYKPASALTKRQIKNSCEPIHHGKLVGMYALNETWTPLDSDDDGYAYDWIFIYEIK